MNQEDRENELLALESILDSSTFKFNDSTGRLDIFPQLSISPIKIHVDLNCGAANDDFPDGELRGVNFLPPYELNFSLPENYPSSESPKFNLSCMWLSTSQLNKLCRKLDDIWDRNTGNVILYDWYQFLQEESLDFLGITDILHLRNEFPSATNESRNNGASVKSQSRSEFRRAIQTASNYAEILPMLLKYDQEKCRENFITTIFACNICFEDKKGIDCLQFKDCGHVYCKKCISSYFEIHITEGAISSLICPEPECKTTALPNQVKDAVKQHLYDRYEKLLLQTTLDTMSDILYCPLVHCQSPVIIEPDATIGQCPSCSYAFCVHCKLAYHGVSPCKIAAREIIRLCKEYEEGDHTKKMEMEKKYGRKVLRKALDDKATQEWVDSNTKPCPGCNAAIQKLDGCNKMTCYKCRAYFCWICMTVLDPANPYRHYNDFNSQCNKRLFEGVDLDDEEEHYMMYI